MKTLIFLMFVWFQFQKHGKVWLTELAELKIVKMPLDFRVFSSQYFSNKNKTKFQKRKWSLDTVHCSGDWTD